MAIDVKKRIITVLFILLICALMSGCMEHASVSVLEGHVANECEPQPQNLCRLMTGYVLFADGSTYFTKVDDPAMQNAIYFSAPDGRISLIYEGSYYNLQHANDGYLYAINAENIGFLPKYLDRINLSSGTVERFGEEILNVYVCNDGKILFQDTKGAYNICDWDSDNKEQVIVDPYMDLADGNSFLMTACDDYAVFYSTRESSSNVYIYDYAGEPQQVFESKDAIVRCYIRDNSVLVLTLSSDPKQYHMTAFSRFAPEEATMEHILYVFDDVNDVYIMNKNEQDKLIADFHCEKCGELCAFDDITVVYATSEQGQIYLFDDETIKIGN